MVILVTALALTDEMRKISELWLVKKLEAPAYARRGDANFRLSRGCVQTNAGCSKVTRTRSTCQSGEAND